MTGDRTTGAEVTGAAGHEIDTATALHAAEILESPHGFRSSLEQVDDAIDTLSKVLSATPPGPLRITILSNLGLIRMVRFQLTASLTELDSAISCFKEAHSAHAAQPPQDSRPELSATIPNLISALHTRAEVTGDWDDLDEAIAWGREAVVRMPPGLSQRAAALASLSSALRIRYERSQYEGDLTEAIDLGRQATVDLPEHHPRQGSVLSNLGSALMAAGLAEESVAVYEKAVAEFATSGNRHGRARTLNNLAGALIQTGRVDAAAETYRAALREFQEVGDQAGGDRVRKNLAASAAMVKGAGADASGARGDAG
ncbi:tetratricopeptide repeat protein [Streptomyces sp. NPDC048638]|uniref:tetratricopeptide repeat protein n=1 Tax=Streptomyces sp. NPDC048638 TaxID=3365580 RepID=UPI0037186DCA